MAFQPLVPREQYQVTIPDQLGPKDDPSVLHPEIAQLRADAELAVALMGGTKAMRETRDRYLPRMRHEDTETYDNRLKITVLRNFYRQSLSSLAGKLMRNGLRLDDANKQKGPAKMGDWMKDMDCAGTPADILFKRCFTWAIRDAAMWLLADYPVTGGVQTLADERAYGIRPWLIPLSIWDVLGWRYARDSSGRRVLDQFRYMMREEVPDGPFAITVQETVRVVTPVAVADYRKNKRGKWELVNTYVNTLGRVPVSRLTSDMDESDKPRGGMTDLAYMNLEHWQLRSDQRLSLRINSFPILFAAGMEGLPPIGPESAVIAESSEARLTYVESGGTNLSAGRQEIVDLEDGMRAMSAQYQVRQQRQTATSSIIDAHEATAPAQGWAVNCKRGFEAAMDDMAELAGEGKGAGAGGVLRLDTEQLVSQMDVQQLTILTTARQSNQISRETYLAALKRADLLPDDFDAEYDQELIDKEPPPDLPGMNAAPPIAGVKAPSAQPKVAVTGTKPNTGMKS